MSDKIYTDEEKIKRLTAWHEADKQELAALRSQLATVTAELDKAKSENRFLSGVISGMENAENEKLEQVTAEREAMLKSDSQSVDEFNAGFDAYNSGMDLDNAEEFYRACKREEGVPSYDSFGTGYAWAKFVGERTPALKGGKG